MLAACRRYGDGFLGLIPNHEVVRRFAASPRTRVHHVTLIANCCARGSHVAHPLPWRRYEPTNDFVAESPPLSSLIRCDIDNHCVPLGRRLRSLLRSRVLCAIPVLNEGYGQDIKTSDVVIRAAAAEFVEQTYPTCLLIYSDGFIQDKSRSAITAFTIPSFDINCRKN